MFLPSFFHNRLRSIIRIADVDIDYTGNAGKVLQVDASEEGIDLGPAGSSHAHPNLTELDLVSDGDHDIRTDNPHGVTFGQLGGTLDHDVLNGLGDDDHTQYILVAGTRAFSGNQSFGDNNITNVGDIALDTLSSASGTSIAVNLGTDAGDDFIVGNNNAMVVTGDNDFLGLGIATPFYKLHLFSTVNTDIMLETTAVNGQIGFRLRNDAQTWRLFINAVDNFLLKDVTGGGSPFRFEPGAPTNSFRMKSDGSVAFGYSITGGAQILILPNLSTVIGQIIRGAVSQSVNLQEWQNNSGDILASIDENGNMLFSDSAFPILDKASGNGIKIDTTTPTFGWRDLRAEIRTRGVGATDPNDTTYIGNVKAYSFAVNDEAWIEFHIPHDYVKGTDILLHYHWSHNSAVVTGGSITLGADVTYAKGHDQIAFAATVNPTLSPNASTTQYQHMVSEVQLSAASPSAAQIDTDDLEPDGLILARVYLSANNITSDGAVPDPFIHEVDIHYQSTNIATKQNAPDFYV